jgi:uroporphyrinogen-III decarboxylase
MNSRDRFLAAAACQPLERPPLWVMRQAGRYLPEYRALKAKSSFLEMVKTPALATEVTLQPLRRFALDAAISRTVSVTKAASPWPIASKRALKSMPSPQSAPCPNA